MAYPYLFTYTHSYTYFLFFTYLHPPDRYPVPVGRYGNLISLLAYGTGTRYRYNWQRQLQYCIHFLTGKNAYKLT